MNLHAAQAFLLRDQRNWRKPHLSWLPGTLYRYYGLPNTIRGRRK
ncbi:hypothetical protein RUM8411_04090 [Ruegeria meonggei]|uniref:Uncharacterized protein n=1 Tax=Ruegeria meonggei TaxID=1446476 RepID=A0A1X7AB80_9RHOB|nr:hypothetical protein RUM8411_04090 [Ruegeria meonggei]